MPAYIQCIFRRGSRQPSLADGDREAELQTALPLYEVDDISVCRRRCIQLMLTVCAKDSVRFVIRAAIYLITYYLGDEVCHEASAQTPYAT
jgi:hypothetical protein